MTTSASLSPIGSPSSEATSKPTLPSLMEATSSSSNKSSSAASPTSNGNGQAAAPFSGLDTLTYVASTVERSAADQKDENDGESKNKNTASPPPATTSGPITSVPSTSASPSNSTAANALRATMTNGVLPLPVPQSSSTSSPMSISSLTNSAAAVAAAAAHGSSAAAAAAHNSYYSYYAPLPTSSTTNLTPPPPLPTGASNILPPPTQSSPTLTPKNSSGRRKKQCAQCRGWFSNLATHKSIHLADNSRPHSCEVCGRGFARPNDLFRHQKSHRGDAPFRCPLYTRHGSLGHSGYSSYTSAEPTCHQNGGFSRCDTYKNHLKAMHFEYPAGTKKRDRSGMSGKCKGCGLTFATTEQWITDHIESGQCEGIMRIRAMNDHDMGHLHQNHQIQHHQQQQQHQLNQTANGAAAGQFGNTPLPLPVKHEL